MFNLIKWALLVLVLFGVGWVISFGTLDPCTGMRNEARRLARGHQRFFGDYLVEPLIDVKTRDYTTAECIVEGFRLQWGGREVVKEMIRGDRPRW